MARQKAIREKYFINLNGQQIEVSQEVYYAYYGGERRERYLDERDTNFGVTTFSNLTDNEHDILDILPSNSNVQVDVEQKESIQRLRAALHNLSEKDFELINKLFYLDIPLSQIAKQENVSKSAISQRKSSILIKLRKLLESNA